MSKVKSWFGKGRGELFVDVEIHDISFVYRGDWNPIKTHKYVVGMDLSQQAVIALSKAMGWEYQGEINEKYEG
jgi:hypothetical protein